MVSSDWSCCCGVPTEINRGGQGPTPSHFAINTRQNLPDFEPQPRQIREQAYMWAACCLGFFASFAQENSQFRAMNLTTHRGICQCRMWQWTPWITHWGCKWGLRVRKWINGAAVYASWLEELRRRFVP